MNEPEIKQLARDYLCQKIELELYNKIPCGTYGFDPDEELLFGFRLFGRASLGASEYLSVSKTTGKVRYRGFLGQ